MLLVDRHIKCCAIDFGCRSDYNALHIAVLCRLAYVECSRHVCVDVAFRSYIAVWDSDKSRKMEDGIDIAGYMTAECCVADVATYHFKIRMIVALKPSPVEPPGRSAA